MLLINLLSDRIREQEKVGGRLLGCIGVFALSFVIIVGYSGSRRVVGRKQDFSKICEILSDVGNNFLDLKIKISKF